MRHPPSNARNRTSSVPPSMDARRRALVAGGLAACAAWPNHLLAAGAAGEAAPPFRISLAHFGGVPGAEAPILKAAFAQAFDALRQNNGGMLIVPPGIYDFGKYAESELIVRADDLSNIVISAYGATFRATTTAKSMPSLFYFVNPYHVTLAGARFTDPGFDPSVNWKGMYCAGIQAHRPSRGFKMVDCAADNVIGLFSTNNNSSTRHLLQDIHIQGEVRNAYYGVGASYVREGVSVELRCHNVRRAFIAYALKDARIKVTASSTPDCLGSNGLVALVSVGGSDNVERVRVTVDASGAGVYGSYVHFYHQGPIPSGYMRDIDATVNVDNVQLSPNLFVFDHESGSVQRTTKRTWDRIYLHGKIAGDFDGRVISNPSVSSAPGKIYADRNLATLADLAKLPSYFVVNAL